MEKKSIIDIKIPAMLKIEVYKFSHVMRKLIMAYANNKGADHSAHLRSLISTFVVHFLDTCYIRNFKTLTSLCSWVGHSESYLVENPEDRLSRDGAQLKVVV